MKPEVAALFVSIWLPSFAGCAVGLTAAGQEVRLGKTEPSSTCRELGIVRGSGGGGAWTSTESKMESAQNEIRNRTADMDGNYVVLDVVGGDVLGMTLSGRAYSCPRGAAVPRGAVAVPAERPQPTPAGSPALSPAERIKQLQELLDKGLITQQEYEARRREIIQSL